MQVTYNGIFFQLQKLDPGAKSIGVTSGTTGFQSAFLSSISPNSAEKQKGSNNSEGSESTSSVPTSVSNGSSSGLLTTSTPNAVSMGGSSTQRRALQNLPQNTKVVRGPNGQYSLQKVQTIELTFEQQNVSKFYFYLKVSIDSFNFSQNSVTLNGTVHLVNLDSIQILSGHFQDTFWMLSRKYPTHNFGT